MKKLISEEYRENFIRKMYERWGFVLQLKNDGSRYGSMDLEDWVQNDILGVCKVKEIVDLERSGAIIYQDGYWRIATKDIQITSQNRDLFHAGRFIGEYINVPSDAWSMYCKRKKTQVIAENKRAFSQLAMEN
jgi:hypothetical protein